MDTCAGAAAPEGVARPLGQEPGPGWVGRGYWLSDNACGLWEALVVRPCTWTLYCGFWDEDLRLWPWNDMSMLESTGGQ